MRNLKLPATDIIDLGKASVETRGQAIFENDGSGGRLVYLTGSAED